MLNGVGALICLIILEAILRLPQLTVLAYHFNRAICLGDVDNGCGIPKEYLGDIFEPSFTLKASSDVGGSYKTGIKGTGYGMANVKKYIDQLKGTIHIESEPNKGTKNIILLPLTHYSQVFLDAQPTNPVDLLEFRSSHF